MDDPALVSSAHGIGQREGELEELVQGDALGWDQLREAPALDQLHGQEGHAVGFLDGIDGDDVGVIEGGYGAGLALEALAAGGIGGQGLGQALEGDAASQLGVLGGVDFFAHAALAERPQDPIVAQGLSEHARPLERGRNDRGRRLPSFTGS